MRPQDHTAHAVTTLNVAADGTVTGQTRQSNTGFFGTVLRLAGTAVQSLGSETAAGRQLQSFNTPGSGRFDPGNIGETVDPAVITGSFTLNDRFKAPAAGGRALIPAGMPLTVRPGGFLLGARLSGRKSAFVCYAGQQTEDIEAKFAPGLPLPQPLRPSSIDNPSFSYRSTFMLADRTLKVHREFISHVAAQVCPAEVETQIANDMNTVRLDVYTSYAFTAPPPPAAAPPTPPQTAEVGRIAIMDRKLRLDFLTSLNPDCSSLGFITVRIVEPAQHGNVAVDHGTGFPNYAQNNPRVECNKRQMEGTVVFYDPNSGFVGADSLTLEAISPSGGSLKRHYSISIDPGPAAGPASVAGPIQSAKAIEYARVAVADQALQLAFLFDLNPDCSSIGYATVRVIEEPKHGKLVAEEGTGFSTFPQTNIRFECNKRRTDGVNLSYIPEAGYVGADSMTLGVINADGTYNKRRYKIEVK
jgi:hypothetical protein